MPKPHDRRLRQIDDTRTNLDQLEFSEVLLFLAGGVVNHCCTNPVQG